VNAGSAAGMLVGGPIIGALGAEIALIGSGLVTAAVAVLVLLRCQTATPVRPNPTSEPGAADLRPGSEGPHHADDAAA
jgi:hypothetical protein